MTRFDAQLSPRERRIKKAIRDLIGALGGPTDAAKAIRQPKRQPRISAYGRPNSDAFAPINMIVELEDAAEGAPGWPFVIRQLACEFGFELFRLPTDGAADTEWGQRIAALFKEVGDVAQRMGEALANDNRVDGGEAEKALPDAYELRRVVIDLVAALEAQAGVK